MQTNINVVYPGTCAEAFALCEQVFGAKRTFSMTFGEAPHDMELPPGNDNLILHTAMPLGTITLMGCDSPKDREETLGGFQVSITVDEESEAKRIFAALSEGGQVQMPPAPTFWTPLFSMFKDKYGVGWMVGLPGPQPQQ